MNISECVVGWVMPIGKELVDRIIWVPLWFSSPTALLLVRNKMYLSLLVKSPLNSVPMSKVALVFIYGIFLCACCRLLIFHRMPSSEASLQLVSLFRYFSPYLQLTHCTKIQIFVQKLFFRFGNFYSNWIWIFKYLL